MVTDFTMVSPFAKAIAFAERSVEATEKTGDTYSFKIKKRGMPLLFPESVLYTI